MQLVVVGVGLEVTDYLLPVGREDVSISAIEALVDLEHGLAPVLSVGLVRILTFDHNPVYNSGTGTYPWPESCSRVS